jgi:hypothetical protein
VISVATPHAAVSAPVASTGVSAARWTVPEPRQRRTSTRQSPASSAAAVRPNRNVTTSDAGALSHSSSSFAGHLVHSTSGRTVTVSSSGGNTASVQPSRTRPRSSPGATRPLGKATSSCANAPIHSDESALPAV